MHIYAYNILRNVRVYVNICILLIVRYLDIIKGQKYRKSGQKYVSLQIYLHISKMLSIFALGSSLIYYYGGRPKGARCGGCLALCKTCGYGRMSCA